MLATKTRYTFADLLEQAPDDENIYDVLGGELVVWPSPVEPHAAVVLGFVLFLGTVEDAGYGHVRTAPRAVAFDFSERGMQAQDVTHPDVLFVRKARARIMGFSAVEASPDLVIEVLSPTTREDDLPGGRKFAIYDRYGVPYYWIADHGAPTVSQYTWRDGRYGKPGVLRPGDVLSCPLFPGVTIDVGRIFARIVS